MLSEPCFGQTGSSAELYPASRTGPPEPTHAHVWAERNLQTRWLLKAHAEAFMGNSELTGLLRSEDERFRKLDDDGGSSSTGPLLAVGEMLNLSNVRRPTVAPVLAAATGESGELLRLVRIEDTRWGWDDAGGTRLHLSVVDPVDHEDQVLWASDGLPISQIKFAAGPAVRWLLVQKPTSTAILFPEYNKVPRYESRSYGDDSGQQPMLSRINPMPLLTLSHRNTGGNAHSDVAFNPPADDRMPQLAVVDECGYWTLWNVVAYSRADRKKLRLALSRCGHIFEGALPVIPGQSAWPAEKHGVLFAGTRGAADPLFQDDFFHDLDDAHKTAQRSTHLVLWNSERFVVVDIESGDALPSMADFSTAKSRFGRILDVRLDPLDQNRVFVLTARFVVWVDVVVPAQPEAPPKSSLITSCPHRMEHSDGLRMFVGPSTTDAEGAVPMVFVSSSSDHQVGVHWFNVDPRNRLAQWHSRLALVMQSPEQGEGSGSKPFAPRELAFYPCKFASTAPASGAGFRYRQAGVQFYQGMALGQDLSVRYCMCFAATGPKMDVVPPTVRIGWTQKQQDRRRKKKRSQMLSFMGETVVVPDSMTDKVIRSLENRRPTTVDETRGDDVVDEGASNPVYLKIPLVFEAIKQRLYGDQEPSAGLPRAYLDLLRDVVHERFLGEPVPFMTW